MATQHKNVRNISGESQNNALPMYCESIKKIPNISWNCPFKVHIYLILTQQTLLLLFCSVIHCTYAICLLMITCLVVMKWVHTRYSLVLCIHTGKTRGISSSAILPSQQKDNENKWVPNRDNIASSSLT